MQTAWQGLDEAFAVWLGAARFTVLGHSLGPLTLFHRELLRLAGHPLATEQPLDLAALDLACRLCALSPKQAAAELRKPLRWWHKVRFCWTLLRYGRHLDRERAVFDAWIKASTTPPEFMAPEQKGEKREVPPTLDLLISLGAKGFDVERVGGEWPIALAEWTYLVAASREANIKFISDEDRLIQQEIAAMQAASSTAVWREEIDWPVRMLRAAAGIGDN